MPLNTMIRIARALSRRFGVWLLAVSVAAIFALCTAHGRSGGPPPHLSIGVRG